MLCYNCKKLFYIIGAMCGFVLMASCTTSKQTISTSTYQREIETVNESLESMGYYLSGTSSDQKNEVYVSAVSYSSQTGYGSAMDNDYYWYDTYRFTDSANNTASYQVKYKLGKDDRDKQYVTNVSVVGCDCSNKKDYATVCGKYGAINSLNYLKNDQVSVFNDSGATWGLVTCSLLAAELVAGIVLLTTMEPH